MSTKRFLEFMQELLTMTDADSETSKQCAMNILENIIALAKESGKCDTITLRMMITAKIDFTYIIQHKEDFVGSPGDWKNNLHKRHRLNQILQPGC